MRTSYFRMKCHLISLLLLACIAHAQYGRPFVHPECTQSCNGRADGQYIHCDRCDVFVMCSNSYLSVMPCPATTYYDGTLGVCLHGGTRVCQRGSQSVSSAAPGPHLRPRNPPATNGYNPLTSNGPGPSDPPVYAPTQSGGYQTPPGNTNTNQPSAYGSYNPINPTHSPTANPPNPVYSVPSANPSIYPTNDPHVTNSNPRVPGPPNSSVYPNSGSPPPIFGTFHTQYPSGSRIPSSPVYQTPTPPGNQNPNPPVYQSPNPPIYRIPSNPPVNQIPNQPVFPTPNPPAYPNPGHNIYGTPPPPNIPTPYPPLYPTTQSPIYRVPNPPANPTPNPYVAPTRNPTNYPTPNPPQVPTPYPPIEPTPQPPSPQPPTHETSPPATFPTPPGPAYPPGDSSLGDPFNPIYVNPPVGSQPGPQTIQGTKITNGNDVNLDQYGNPYNQLPPSPSPTPRICQNCKDSCADASLTNRIIVSCADCCYVDCVTGSRVCP